MKHLIILLALLLTACSYTATPYGSSLSINAVPYYYPYYNGYYYNPRYYQPYYRRYYSPYPRYYNGWNRAYPRPYYGHRPWHRHR